MADDKKTHWPEPTRPFKFQLGEVALHYKGGEYVVVGLPDDNVLESSREPAYAYRSVTHPGGPRILRSQSDMETPGRFTSQGRLIQSIALLAQEGQGRV